MRKRKSCLKNCCICKKPFYSAYPNKNCCGRLECRKIADCRDQKKYRNNVKLRVRKKAIEEIKKVPYSYVVGCPKCDILHSKMKADGNDTCESCGIELKEIKIVVWNDLLKIFEELIKG